MELLQTEYDHEKVLLLSRDDFLFGEDFDIQDLDKDLENILQSSDLKAIRRCLTKEEKIDKLFFLLVIRGQATFENFLCALRKIYPWLAEGIERRLNTERMNRPNNHINDFHNNAHQEYPYDDYYEKILKLRKELPKFVDFNIHRCQLLWDIRRKTLALSLPHHQYLVVHGSLSQGKRWVVMDALCSYQIMRRMGGNVFWIDCSKCRTNESILMQLEKLFIKSQPVHDFVVTPSNFNDINNKILSYTESLRRIFDKGALKECLLVLLDVQNGETIRAFDLNCRTLITTRDKKILDRFPDTEYKVEIDCGFTDSECKDLFSKVLKIPKDKLPDEVIDIHRMCKHNPFVLSVIAFNLKQYESHINRWKHWKTLLEKNESTSFAQLRKPIEESLKDLKKSNESLIYRLESLVIFIDNVKIPMRVLQLYWNLSEHDVAQIIETLDGLYLLQRIFDGREMYCSLHYLYFSYLTKHITSEDKQRMHNNLVNGYRITEALRNRSEPNIADLPNDEYFHYYIGYHLKESGPQARHLFPLLYYDFGFLEQKLRNTGLSNTLGDFKLYGDEIKESGDNRIPIDELTDFLAYIEESLMSSQDGCLLQHALSEENSVGREARLQAQKFKKRMWFSDTVHSKYRQIIKLPEDLQPKYINFFDPNTSLIAFSDHSIHLIDMAFEYTAQSSIYCGHTSAICDIQLFLKHFFVSLDVSGTIKVWSLKDTEIGRRRVSRQEETIHGARQGITSPRTSAPSQDHLHSFDNGQNRITSILISSDGELMAAAADGEVLVYHWQQERKKYELRRSLSIKTNNKNIVKMIVLGDRQKTLMTVNNVGETNFHNLTDHSMVPKTVDFPKESPLNVYHLPHENPKISISDQQIIAVVFPSGVYQLQLSRIRRQVVEHLSQYNFCAEQNTITCCTITDDGKYLMLGTRKGIIVLDPKTNREMLRSSISDKLTSIDVCTVHGSVCKYMLISATKKSQSVIYVHGIHFKDNLMQWSTNKFDSRLNPRDTMVAWFRGGKVFDVSETSDGLYTLVAVDLKELVHTKSSLDNFNKTIRYDQFDSCATNISIGAERKFVGCKNGSVFEIKDEPTEIMKLERSVDYLRYFEELNVLIAGSNSEYKVNAPRKSSTVPSALIQNTFVYGKHLIIILKVDGSFELLDMSSSHRIESKERADGVICSCFYNDKIAVGTNNRNVSIYKIKNETIVHLNTFETDANINFKSIDLTESDTLLVAVGYENGLIELLDVGLNTNKVLDKLLSHSKDVHSLHFSPRESNTPEAPIILVSLSSEICFWNVTHILNNPMDRSMNRHSRRFNRPASNNEPFKTRNDNGRPDTNGNTHQHPMNKQMKELSLNTQSHSIAKHLANNLNGNQLSENPWIGKSGSSEKPQLLSCIKFVGSTAEKIFINKKFTTFITIDNEGEVYYLKALDVLETNDS